jgi:hypothetical protein
MEAIMARMLIDPPSGWNYGFPKVIPSNTANHRLWLIENGYPEKLIDEFGDHFYCRYWMEPDEGETATLEVNHERTNKTT